MTKKRFLFSNFQNFLVVYSLDLQMCMNRNNSPPLQITQDGSVEGFQFLAPMPPLVLYDLFECKFTTISSLWSLGDRMLTNVILDSDFGSSQ